ncbi:MULTISPECIES: isocitrate lyase/PEP mutase family protein [unclassified Streptomyces]|uniref:isocitrate lyase/PEP mutase family protein n=1 Tax=unclassified Streptomyces TaxID=2593676 RepID=UPI000DADE33B|nr:MULTISPECIES: isocitrate lyase/phosphoenolpyruvate mutase family protein [unclassified Streptomyces]PZT76221.1 isocitrate lyase/phosphoenolpyruvate mutase family protein [Streptomyces sp. AC1-42W]PZT79826.1 isocitrate lyase/phosphoenolpyruvate mutase family protein [Streptomyces sp. AC1-42T]
MTASGLRALHRGRAPGDPLVLPGPWDAASARAFADAGFPALATPSAGVAASLGYEDGSTPAGEMFAAVARIVRAVSVPVSADIEAGYGLPAGELVERLLAAGAVGCNLEDTVDGVLVAAERQADRLAAVRAAAGDALFVNARIDTFVTGVPDGTDPEAETLRRARLYAEAGADCLYPILAPEAVFGLLAGALPGLPVNALARPDGPGPRRLGELGATRITFGPGLQRRADAAVREIAGGLRRL